jgi:CRP-like cAMP-binding protein
VSVLRDDGREALQSVLQAGDCFGICSMIDGGTRYQTTTTNDAVELQVLHREACERLRSQHPSFGDGLVRHMSRHSRLLSDYFVSSTLDELSSRVAMRLLGLSVALSQSEIALMVGASRQAVNKVLQKFQVDGLIHIEYGSVRLLDIERLRCLV